MKKILFIFVFLFLLGGCDLKETYHVSFDSLGGTEFTVIEVQKGNKVNLPIPEKEGHQFKGWFTGFTENDRHFTNVDVVNRDITLYAKWDVITYTITFKLNDGTGQSFAIFDHGSALDIQEPTKTGYSFGGWYDDEDLNNQFDDTITNDKTLYAKWIINQYTISFELNEGTGIESIQIEHNTVLDLEQPVKPGYDFHGWYLDSEFNQNFNIKNQITNDLTLFAKWEVTTYQITFVTNTSNLLEPIILAHGENIDLTIPVRVGHQFVGWYLDSDFEEVFDIDIITNDLIVYAKWNIESYEISFQVNGGEQLNPFLLDYGTNISLPIPVRSGYEFVRWYLDSNLNIPFRYQTMPEYDFKVYADWIDERDVRPDLRGYTIRIAQAAHLLHETDPFHPDYIKQDKHARQQAWIWVEHEYNCMIQVEAYPADAEWGTPRWNYILNQAAYSNADHDFYTVPDSKIGLFVEGNAILNVLDWYELYGEDLMDSIYYTSGSYKDGLYSITDAQASISNVIYYNTNLLESLGMEKTPGQLFNEDNWTYSAFKDYVLEAQTRLSEKGEDYIALAGMPTYYWVGMANAGGVNIANTSTLQIDALNLIAEQAATVLQEIYHTQAMDKDFSVDQSVESWMNGRALFNSGDLWFVNASNRWPYDLWGEDTKYDFVPFPRPDSVASKADQQIGLPGQTTQVMVNHRSYHGYPSTVNPENIYRAYIETLLKTQEFLSNDPSYNEEINLIRKAEKYNASECSIEAFIYVSELTKTNGFFEPLANADNSITHTAEGSLSVAIRTYITDNEISYSEVINPILPDLLEALIRTYS